MQSTIKQKLGKCLDCPEGSPEKPLIAKRCNTHYWQHRASVKNPKSEWKEPKRKEMNAFLKPRKPIPKVSKKRAVENAKYTVQKIVFMSKPENKICPITGTPTTDVHHVKKRIGFADSWARINNVPLLLDERYWLAVSRLGHIWIHDNPEEATKLGYLK